MSFSKFLSEIQLKEEEKKSDELRDKILNFIIENPYPQDSAIHNFAKELGMEPDKLETQIYAILSDFFTGGKSKGDSEGLDQDQLQKGIKVEMEHSPMEIVAKKIASDHLKEIPDYYDRLATMEKDAKINEAEAEPKEKTVDTQVGSFTAPLYKVRKDTESLVGLPDLKRISDSILEWWKTQDPSRGVPEFVKIAKDLYNLK